jgi:hypothetical protein
MTGLPSALANTIVDEFLGGEKRPLLLEGLERDRKDREAFSKRVSDVTAQKVAGTQPSRSPDACMGTYRCPLYGNITVTKNCDRLVLSLLPNPELVADLTHLHYDTWKITWRKEFAWFAEGTIQFVPDANGNFQELRLNVPNDDLWFDELKPVRVQ